MQDDGALVIGDLTRPALPPTIAVPLPTLPTDVVRTEAPAWVGKRAVDVAMSALLLVLALPLFLVIAVVVKLSSPGPVFFGQKRVGRGGSHFRMLKFRTMRADSEEWLRSDRALHELFLASDHKIPCHLDPRITRVGRVLRRLSLDELPQLLNVLCGHMSMVGPRPVVPNELQEYGVHQHAYVALRPGLTGLWQVSGRSTVQFPERAELDSRYLRTCGPLTDAKIILRTPIVVITGLGAN